MSNKRPARAKLNRRFIDAMPSPPPGPDGATGRSYIYDAAVQRLAICAWSTGARTWYWIGRANGRPARFKLGEYPTMARKQARKEAARLSATIADGKDPRAEKRRARAEMTLADLFERYLDDYARPHKKTWAEDAGQFSRYCGPIKSRPISGIDRQAITALHARIGKDRGRYSANRLLALLSTMFAFAIRDLGFTGPNPAKGVKKFRETERERYLSADELQRFFQALDAEAQLFQDFFRVLLFTGVRRGNAQAMRFEEIDFAQRTWRIPDTKNGDSLTVHLTGDVLEILWRRQAQSGGSEWVFPRKNLRGHVPNPKHAWERVIKRAGLSDLHQHDLRRTLGSWQAAGGASLLVIGKSLGHRSLEATKLCSRLDLEPVRASVDTAVATMMAAAKGR